MYRIAAVVPKPEGALSEQQFLPFARPSITDAERAAVLEVLDSGWLTTGPKVGEFEAAFAEKVRARHAIAVNSATAALHLALEAVGVRPGDEVIIPTWTFTSSAAVILHLGARPVIVDINPVTLNVDPDAIGSALTDRTKAVIVVHFGGLPAAMRGILREVVPHRIPVIEDTAHAFPSRLVGDGLETYAGTLGSVGAFSFYATKTITTGEGGMLVTDSDEIADRARLMSLHGMSKDSWKRYTATGSWRYDVAAPGYKYNLTDLAAALGLVQLSRAEELLAERRTLAGRYRAGIAEAGLDDALELPYDPEDGSHAWHLFVIRVRPEAMGLDRDRLIEALRDRGIGTSVHFIPLHQHTAYRQLPGGPGGPFPHADREADRVLSLPIWPGMGTDGVDRVIAALADARRVATATS
jgi:dTDP-4-amino-4,6-dideoxygalactose transaminase